MFRPFTRRLEGQRPPHPSGIPTTPGVVKLTSGCWQFLLKKVFSCTVFRFVKRIIARFSFYFISLQLRSIEEPLKIFLTEYDDSLTWISENEVLLKPAMASDHMEKHKDLLEVSSLFLLIFKELFSLNSVSNYIETRV